MTRSPIAIAALLLTAAAALADGGPAELHSAVAANDTLAVTRLLAVTDVDAETESGNTSLMVAAAYGYTAMARLLVDAGADVNARGRIGNTALICAAQEGHTDIVRALVEAGARGHDANEYGNTALSLACGYGHREIVGLLEGLPEEPQKPLLAQAF
jgi:ankyrin repeat protein